MEFDTVDERIGDLRGWGISPQRYRRHPRDLQVFSQTVIP